MTKAKNGPLSKDGHKPERVRSVPVESDRKSKSGATRTQSADGHEREKIKLDKETTKRISEKLRAHYQAERAKADRSKKEDVKTKTEPEETRKDDKPKEAIFHDWSQYGTVDALNIDAQSSSSRDFRSFKKPLVPDKKFADKESRTTRTEGATPLPIHLDSQSLVTMTIEMENGRSRDNADDQSLLSTFLHRRKISQKTVRLAITKS